MVASIPPSSRPTPETPAAVAINNMTFRWPGGDQGFQLQVPAFDLAQGDTCFLVGPSGSGKSTLLALLAGLMAPDSGSIRLAGTALEKASRRRRDHFRADHIGVIFQQFNLVPYLSPLDNVLLPCQFSRRRRDRAGSAPRETAMALLSGLGLDLSQLGPDVRKLSIGQQQRVAAARALIGDPEIILADEPTSALDTDHRDRFVDLLLAQARQHGSSVLFVSHDHSLQTRFDSTRDIRDWRDNGPDNDRRGEQ